MVRALVIAVLLASPAMAAKVKKKVPPPPPPPKELTCLAFDPCLATLKEVFESGDFENAQRLATRLEGVATSPAEKAHVLALHGALDAQSLGLTPETRDTIRRLFAEAQRLDATLSVTAIPPFARTEALEALWVEARPKVEPVVTVPPPNAPPLVVPALDVAPEPKPRRVSALGVVFTAAAIAAAGAGTTFAVWANIEGTHAQTAVFDVDRAALFQSAQTRAWVATGSFIGAGVMVAVALLAFLVDS